MNLFGARRQDDISLLFPIREGRFQVLHKSVVDFLQRKDDEAAGAQFFVDDSNGHAALAEACEASLDSGAAGGRVDYAVRFGVRHLCEAGQLKEARARLLDFGWLLRRAQSDALGVALDGEL